MTQKRTQEDNKKRYEGIKQMYEQIHDNDSFVQVQKTAFINTIMPVTPVYKKLEDGDNISPFTVKRSKTVYWWEMELGIK